MGDRQARKHEPDGQPVGDWTHVECPHCREMQIVPVVDLPKDLRQRGKQIPCTSCNRLYEITVARWQTVVSNTPHAVVAFMAEIIDLRHFEVAVGQGWRFEFTRAMPRLCGTQVILAKEFQESYNVVAADVSHSGLTLVPAFKPGKTGPPSCRGRCIAYGRRAVHAEPLWPELLWEAKQCVARQDSRTQVLLSWAAWEAWLDSEFSRLIDPDDNMNDDLKDGLLRGLGWRFKLTQVYAAEEGMDRSAREELDRIWKLRCQVAHGRWPEIHETDAQSAFATVVSLITGTPPWQTRSTWGWWGIGQPRPESWEVER